MKYNTALGWYVPSFYKLMAKNVTPENINDINAIKHEYFHFMQDLIISFNINYSLINYTKLQCALHYLASKDQSCSVPVNVSKVCPELQEANDYISCCSGEADYIDCIYASFVSIKTESCCRIGRNEIKNSTAIFKCDGKETAINFSAMVLNECMADLAEAEVCKGKTNNDKLPYEVPFYIYEGIIKEKCPIDAMFAFCEYSLSCFDPPTIFLSLINEIKCKELCIKNYENARDFLDGRDSDVDRFIDKVDLFKLFKDRMEQIFKGDQLGQMAMWVYGAVSFGLSLDSASLTPVAKFFSEKRLHQLYNTFFEKVGVPPVFDGDGKYVGCYHSDINIAKQMMKFSMLSSIGEVVLFGKEECYFPECPYRRDHACVNDLQLSAKFPELCPVGVFIKTWSITWVK